MLSKKQLYHLIFMPTPSDKSGYVRKKRNRSDCGESPEG